MSKSAAKVPAKKSTTTTRAKTLTPADARRQSKVEKEAAAHAAAQREKRLAYNKAYAARKKAERQAEAKPAAAKGKPASPVAAPAAALDDAMTLSKVELVGAIKAAYLSAPNVQERLGLRIALQLALKLED